MPALEVVSTDNGIPPFGPYQSHAMKSNGFMFLSGQIPAKLVDRKVQIVKSSATEQAHAMLKNAQVVLEAAGPSLGRVVRATLYLVDMKDLNDVNQVYAEYLPQRPARSCFEAPRLPAGIGMEIDLIAVEYPVEIEDIVPDSTLSIDTLYATEEGLKQKSPCDGDDWNLLHYLGGNGPWIEKIDGEHVSEGIGPPERCSIEQVHMMSRHGERYPTKSAGSRHLALLSRIRESNVPLNGSLSLLNNWSYFTSEPEKDFDQLTATGPYAGKLQAFTTGVRFVTRYGHLLQKHTKTRLWASECQRVIETAQHFASGMFGLDWEKSGKAELEIIPETFDQRANTLTPGDTCLKYLEDPEKGHDNGMNMRTRFQEVYAPVIAKRLISEQGNLALGSFSDEEIFSMQEMCGYETIARGSSPWCDVFTKEEWESFEYARDIIHYYRAGPGNPYAGAMGWLWLNATTALLQSGPGVGAMFFSFVHDGDIAPFLTALDIMKDPQYDPSLPITHIAQDRKWRTSSVMPMGARIVLERMTCPSTSAQGDKSEQENFVRININDRIVPLPYCRSGPGHSCPLKEFARHVERRRAEVGDFKETVYGRQKFWNAVNPISAFPDQPAQFSVPFSDRFLLSLSTLPISLFSFLEKFKTPSLPFPSMEYHFVPPEERAKDDKGNLLPWGYVYKDEARNPRRPPEESGPFGRRRNARYEHARSRTRTGTPAKRENPNVAEFGRLFAQQQEDEKSRTNTLPKSSSSSNLDNQRKQTEKVATECILYGYKSKDSEWKVIDKFERISGGFICEDYPRTDPNSSAAYAQLLSGGDVVIRTNLSADANRKSKRYAGGYHWIKVTFDSSLAADRACFYSPQEIDGHHVICEMYHGQGPAEDAPIPATGKTDAASALFKTNPARTLTTSHSTTFLQTQKGKERAASTLPRSFAMNNLSTVPDVEEDASFASTNTASSATATGVDTINNQNASSSPVHQRNVPKDVPVQPPQEKPESEFMTHIPTVRRAQLRPLAEALPPQPTVTERVLRSIPILSWFTGDIVGDGPQLKEDGTFDYEKSNSYWRFWNMLDRFLGTDICGLKEES
ncbi:uncharacterized protein KD926_011116 [Aspergillus affinis]|uniref:uncharacterized protein n=1 Tax=Aspergillus affinis TaxID=1070780 RepID=UPI0022FEC4C6|nr:phosphoglycerate mutase-like protein [Aspergillus affinis]KAI9044943.1 phosphoglycerate mutase-like protein [Aspergillus affinis]